MHGDIDLIFGMSV